MEHLKGFVQTNTVDMVVHQRYLPNNHTSTSQSQKNGQAELASNQAHYIMHPKEYRQTNTATTDVYTKQLHINKSQMDGQAELAIDHSWYIKNIKLQGLVTQTW